MDDAVKDQLLKNMQAKKNQRLSKQAQNEVKQSVTEIRNNFLANLAKVYNNDTRRDGVKVCHQMIAANSDDPDALKIFLTCLCDRSTFAAQ